MADTAEIKVRLDFWRKALTALRRAYLALLDGQVKSYRLEDRELTMLDLPKRRPEALRSPDEGNEGGRAEGGRAGGRPVRPGQTESSGYCA